MYTHLYIDPSAAIRAGKSVSGYARLDLLQSDVDALTSERRDELARVSDLGAPEHGNGTLGRGAGDPPVTEGTLAEIVRVLDARIARRQNEADATKQRSEKYRAEVRHVLTNRLTCEKSTYHPPVGYLSMIHPDWPITRTDTEWRIRDEIAASAEAVAWVSELETINAQHLATAEKRKIADEQAQMERESQFRAAAEAVVSEIGSDADRGRLSEHLLPDTELLHLVHDHVFAALTDHERYTRITESDVRDAHDEDLCSDFCAKFAVDDATELPATEWAALVEVRTHAPEGSIVTPRIHKGYCPQCEGDREVTRYSALLQIDWHGRKLSREYAL